jgi:hypothetical protein
MKIPRICTLWSPRITLEKAQLEEVEVKLKPSKNLNSMVHGLSGVGMVQLVSEFIWLIRDTLQFRIGEEQKDKVSC